jgi:hypothetical protein
MDIELLLTVDPIGYLFQTDILDTSRTHPPIVYIWAVVPSIVLHRFIRDFEQRLFGIKREPLKSLLRRDCRNDERVERLRQSISIVSRH